MKRSKIDLYQWALDTEESLRPVEMFFGTLRAQIPIEIDQTKINLDFLKENGQKIEELRAGLETFKLELNKCS